MRNYILLLGLIGLLVSWGGPLQGQNHISQYWQNYFLVNPAYAGQDSGKAANIWSRYSSSQFRQFSVLGAGAAFHAPIHSLNSGYGVSVTYEQATVFTEVINLNGVYSYKVDVGENSDLQFGSGFQLIYRQDSIPAGVGPVFGNQQSFSFALSFGMLYRVGGLTLGVSGLNLNQPQLRNQVPGFQFRIPRVIYGIARYKEEISPDIYFIPGLMIRAVDSRSTVAAELRVDLDFARTFEAGIAYRVSQLGQREYTINGITYNQSVNYVIPRLGLRFSNGAYFYVSYDLPVNSTNFINVSFLEASLRFNWR